MQVRFTPFMLLILFFAKPAFTQKSELKWLQSTIDSSSITDANVLGSTVDSKGNIYSVGMLEAENADDTVFFGNYPVTGIIGSDGYIAKYKASGEVIWVKTITSEEEYYRDNIFDIAVDDSGNCYVLGRHNSTLTVGNDTLAGTGAYLAKTDSNGNFIWARNAGMYSASLCIDKWGDIIVAGEFGTWNGNISKIGNITLKEFGNGDVYIAKFSPAGDVLWHSTYGSIQNGDEFHEVVTDADGNIYMAASMAKYEYGYHGGFMQWLGGFVIHKYDRQGKLIAKLFYKNAMNHLGASLKYSPYENCLFVYFYLSPDTRISDAQHIKDPYTRLLAKYDTDLRLMDAVNPFPDISYPQQFVKMTLDHNYNPVLYGRSYIDKDSSDDNKYNLFISKFDKNLAYVWEDEFRGNYMHNNLIVATSAALPYLAVTGTYGNRLIYYNDTLDNFNDSLIHNDAQDDVFFGLLEDKDVSKGLAVILGDKNVCQGNTASYNVKQETGSKYSWKIKGGTIFSNNKDTNFIHVRWDSLGAQYLTLTQTFANQLKVIDTVKVNVIEKPQLSFNVNDVCEGDTIHISNTSKIPLPHEYKWYFNNFGYDTAFSPTRLTGKPGKFRISLKVYGSCDDSFVKEINILPLPTQPKITTSGDSLYASDAFAYQWFKNNTLLQNATHKWLVPDATADYTVRVTNEKGCSKISSAFKYLAPDTLQGFVLTSDGSPLSHTRIYLLKINYKDTLLLTLDSVLTDNSGFYKFDLRENHVQLIASPDSVAYPFEIPTYYDSSVVISDADLIEIKRGTNIANWRTYQGINNGGTGFISGKITTCVGCKKDEEGEPVFKLKVFLIGEDNKPVAFTYTDWEGKLSFANLPLGKYKVWIDKFMVDNKKAPVIEITSEKQQLLNLHFTLYPNFLALDSATNIPHTIPSKSAIKIFPNPFTQNTDIQFNLSQSQRISVILTDINGRQRIIIPETQMQAGVNQIRVNKYEHKLVPGIYFMHLKTKDGIEVQKLILQ